MMKKLFLTFVATATVLVAAAGGIATPEQLAAFAAAANSGTDLSSWQNEKGAVCLTADIDLGKIKKFARIENFSGTFDGQGHTILNWKATNGGLFGLVSEGSVVRNLIIGQSCSMKVSDDSEDPLYAGFIADVNHGILERCENYGSISHRSARSQHDNYVGGVCGMNKFVVTRCKNSGEISSSGSCTAVPQDAEPRMYLGGVLGGSLGKSLPGAFVAYCENTGKVTYSGAFLIGQVGGIVGYNMRVKVKFSINRGEIVGSAGTFTDGDRQNQQLVGGIIGMAKADVMCCDNFGTITTRGEVYSVTSGICGSAHESMTVGDCDNFAQVSSSSSYQASVGGIVGLSGRAVAITSCRNKGAIRFDGTSVDRRTTVAGIVGDVYAKKDAIYAASIRNCRNEGPITCGLGENTRNSARGMHAAGIVGFINGNEKVSASVRDCINTGNVRSESGRAAGICGFSGFCDFDGCQNSATIDGGGVLLGGIIGGFDTGTVSRSTNRGNVLAGAKGQAGGIAATTWTAGNARIEACRSNGVIKGQFGLAAAILAEGRMDSDCIESCGVGGAVGTPQQSIDGAPKVTAENYEQFITGRNVARNKAEVDRESCYFWIEKN